MESPRSSLPQALPQTLAEREGSYFPELDSLRFFAFLLVFTHHAPVVEHRVGSYVHSFGWIGVDLFLSLSAFLFVKLLAKEYRHSGTIDARKFYIRRGLRIWPLYAIFCLFAMSLSSIGGTVPFLSWRGFGLLTFTDNIFAASQGYDPIAYSAHLWTISYEEQFYLIVPFALLFLFRSPRWRVIVSLSVMAAVLAVLRATLIWLKVPHPAIWVLPVTHFESILLGIVVGLGGFDLILSRIPAILILASGLLCGWLVTRMGPVEATGWHLMTQYVLIGLCTSLVLYFTYRTGQAPWMKWLTFSPMVFLGKISYGLYVYHVLGLALGRRFLESAFPLARPPFPEAPAIFVVSLFITVAMASASYHFIEKPFLKLKKRYQVVASRPV